MKPFSRLLIALCLSPVLAQAAPLSQVTLPDGRQVQLNDDFTWEYLVVKPAESVQGVAAEGKAGAVVAVAAPVLTDQAKANPELLAQMARDGVVVKLDKIEGSDPLVLTFMVSNTGTRNVVGVRGMVTLFSADGVQAEPPGGPLLGCREPPAGDLSAQGASPPVAGPRDPPSCRIDRSAAGAGRN